MYRNVIPTTIGNDGIIEKTEIELESIKQGERVFLTLLDGHHIANPIFDNDWGSTLFSAKPNGVLGQVNMNHPREHTLHPTNGDQVITSDSVLRICTTDKSVAGDRNNMQGTVGSNKVYYVENEDNNKDAFMRPYFFMAISLFKCYN